MISSLLCVACSGALPPGTDRAFRAHLTTPGPGGTCAWEAAREAGPEGAWRRPVQTHAEAGRVRGRSHCLRSLFRLLLRGSISQNEKSHLLGSNTKHIYGTQLSFN